MLDPKNKTKKTAAANTLAFLNILESLLPYRLFTREEQVEAGVLNYIFAPLQKSFLGRVVDHCYVKYWVFIDPTINVRPNRILAKSGSDDLVQSLPNGCPGGRTGNTLYLVR